MAFEVLGIPSFCHKAMNGFCLKCERSFVLIYTFSLLSEKILVWLSPTVRKTLGRHKKGTKDESAEIKQEGTVSN